MMLFARAHPLWAAALLAGIVPLPAAAQTTSTVQGRVIAAAGSPEIEGARVELMGHGVTQSSPAGLFRFGLELAAGGSNQDEWFREGPLHLIPYLD